MMKLTTSQIQRLAEKILNQWKTQNLITFKVEEKVVMSTIIESITKELRIEEELEVEVKGLVEAMEREHGGDFQRHKMFHLLKQKLAKERGVIL